MKIGYSLSQSGLHAQQLKMDQIANDIANVNTTGYKKKTTGFRELLNNNVTLQDVLLADGSQITQSSGVLSGVTGTHFAQGSLQETQEPFNLAIGGHGFFQVISPDGTSYLTRDGAFELDGSGQLVNSQGHTLFVNMATPAGEWPEGDISVTSNGEIWIDNQNVGTIPLFLPENNQALQPVGGNYFAFDDIGLINSIENVEAFGSVQQGYIEQSNVDLAQSMTEMIVAQRAYSLNAQVARSTDDMYQLINHFKN